jgi:hypothetical protein
VTSALQRRSVLALGRTSGALVHTSNDTYRDILRADAVPAETLPLFGSIPPVAHVPPATWLPAILAGPGRDALRGDRRDWWVFVLFGTLHPVWPPEPLLRQLQAAAVSAGKRVAFVSVGHLGAGEALWHQMSETYASTIPMFRLGPQSDARISELLHSADFGVATTPLPLIGKSATVAAMFDHGLPVVVNREDCCWQAAPTHDEREAALVVRIGDGLAERLCTVRRLAPVWRLPEIATRFLESLNTTAASVSAW